MSLRSFWRKSTKRYRRHGVSVVPSILAGGVTEGISKCLPVHRFGRRVFDHEWDVLVILDACRADMYRETVNPDSEVVWSSGSSSLEWMEKNFIDRYADELSRTAYITGNPFTQSDTLSKATRRFGLLDEVWRYEWDDELGTIHPEPVADRTITVGRAREFDRLIAHFMQPHFPFIGAERRWGHIRLGDFGAPNDNPWDRCKLGEVPLEAVERAYRENLEFVWEYVELILNNTDGKVVVSADHGNALGEGGVWGHRNYLVHPSIRRVPWDVYSCNDTKSYTPPTYDRANIGDVEVEQRLSDLGYK